MADSQPKQGWPDPHPLNNKQGKIFSYTINRWSRFLVAKTIFSNFVDSTVGDGNYACRRSFEKYRNLFIIWEFILYGSLVLSVCDNSQLHPLIWKELNVIDLSFYELRTSLKEQQYFEKNLPPSFISDLCVFWSFW